MKLHDCGTYLIEKIKRDFLAIGSQVEGPAKWENGLDEGIKGVSCEGGHINDLLCLWAWNTQKLFSWNT